MRRAASEYLRKAWDAAVDAHAFVRESARLIIQQPKAKPFYARAASLLKLSKMLHLTIHRQQPKPRTVTTLDVVLSEGVAHATVAIKRNARDRPMPATKDKKAAVNALIDAATDDYGELLGSHADDRKLIDWLVTRWELRLIGAPVGDIGVLASLGDLRVLALDHTHVRDLSPLAGLSKLQRLTVAGTPVGDLSPLHAMSALRELDLADTNVADEQVAELQRRLPALSVTRC